MGSRRAAVPPTPAFFSLFYIYLYYITLFGASKVVGTELGSSFAFLLWRSQRVGSGLGFYYYYYFGLKDFLLGHVPHVWSSNCSRRAGAKNLSLN